MGKGGKRSRCIVAVVFPKGSQATHWHRSWTLQGCTAVLDLKLIKSIIDARSWNGCLVGDSDRNILPLQATQGKATAMVSVKWKARTYNFLGNSWNCCLNDHRSSVLSFALQTSLCLNFSFSHSHFGIQGLWGHVQIVIQKKRVSLSFLDFDFSGPSNFLAWFLASQWFKEKKRVFFSFIIVKGSYRVTHVVSQALDRAKPGVEEKKKSPNSRSFKRLVCYNIHLS